MAEEQLYQMLGRVEGKLDSLNDTMRSHIETYQRQHSSLHSRVDELEADVNQAKGAKSIIVVLAGVIGAVVASIAHTVDRWLK